MFKGKTKNGVDLFWTQGMKTPPKKPTWVLVADQAKARFFEKSNGDASLRSVLQVENPSGRAKGTELTTDRPGRSFDSAGRAGVPGVAGGRHSYSSETGPYDQALEKFALRVARTVENARKNGRIGELVVVAQSRLLGLLRQHIDGANGQYIKAYHDHDFAWLSDREVMARVVPLIR